ncbi:MAG: sulfotransferase [Thermoanaerobaculia bacterium]
MASSAPHPPTPAGDRPPPVFVLGFHRGGTTFVQRLLNCHRRVTIWGENAGLVGELRRVVERLAASHVVRGKVDAEAYREFNDFANRFKPWASPFTIDDLVAAAARMLESLYGDPADPGRVWGFKEIRHLDVEDIEFFYRLFPGCRMILLVRHPKSLLLSQLFVRWSDGATAASPEEATREAIAAYARAVDAMLVAAERHAAQAVVLRYESIHPDGITETLFAPLGLADSGLDRGLLETVLRSRVGSSFADVGREVDEAIARRVGAAYDALVEPTLAETASATALEAVKAWYPSLLEAVKGGV